MYNVSAAYRSAMRENAQEWDLRGTIGRFEFTRENIVSGSFSISNSIVDGDSIRIGSVRIGMLKATFTGIDLLRYSWRGSEITPQFGRVLENGETEYIPLGVYTVAAAESTEEGISITAYDHMAKLDGPGLATALHGGWTPWRIAQLACERSGVELGTTNSEFAAFPNGSVKLYLPSLNGEEKTWREMLSWVAELVGCFVTAGRDGKLYFRQYSRDVVDLVNDYHRLRRCRFADYETVYTGISVTYTKTRTVASVTSSGKYTESTKSQKVAPVYSVPPNNGLVYALGENPFFQIENEAIIEQRARAILGALQKIRFVPFTVTAIGDPAYDLGDVIKFTGGIADGSKLYCVMQYDFAFNGAYRMAGVGENPSLSSAKSRAERVAESVASGSSFSDNGTLYVRNDERVEIGNTEKKLILSASYSASGDSHIQVLAEILLEVETSESGDAATGWVETDVVCTVTYVSDGTEMTDRIPVETWQDGRHILSLQYDFTPGGGYSHTFAIWISTVGGSAVVGINHGLMSLSGTSVDEEWGEYPETPEGVWLSYIEVTTLPIKTDYQLGEALDYTGLKVTAVFSDGTENDITGQCGFDVADGSIVETAGPIMVTVSYEDMQAFFNLTVLGQILRIAMLTPSTQVRVPLGDALDYTGLTIGAFYEDGHVEDITADCVFSPGEGTPAAVNTPMESPPSGVLGWQVVNVEYTTPYALFTSTFRLFVTPAIEPAEPADFYTWATANGAPEVFHSPEAYAAYAAPFSHMAADEDGLRVDLAPCPFRLFVNCRFSSSTGGVVYESYSANSSSGYTNAYSASAASAVFSSTGKARCFNTANRSQIILTMTFRVPDEVSAAQGDYQLEEDPIRFHFHFDLNDDTEVEKSLERSPVWVASGDFNAPGYRYEFYPGSFQSLGLEASNYAAISRMFRTMTIQFRPPTLRYVGGNIGGEHRAGAIHGLFGFDATPLNAQSIVDEGGKKYYNPASGNMEPFSTWTYDYTSRTYTLTLGGDKTVTITFGDNEATIFEGGQSYALTYMVAHD